MQGQVYYGDVTLHEFLERTTWHSGQHVRQLMMVLDKLGIAPDQPVGAGHLRRPADAHQVWDDEQPAQARCHPDMRAAHIGPGGDRVAPGPRIFTFGEFRDEINRGASDASAISLISLEISSWPNASKLSASTTNAPGPPITFFS
jgi:hypothetical protein